MLAIFLAIVSMLMAVLGWVAVLASDPSNTDTSRDIAYSWLRWWLFISAIFWLAYGLGL